MSKLFEHVLSYSRMFISMISKHKRSLYICCHCSITSKSFVSLPGYKEITPSPINPGSILKGYANEIVSENSFFLAKANLVQLFLTRLQESVTTGCRQCFRRVTPFFEALFARPAEKQTKLPKTADLLQFQRTNHVPLQVCVYRITEGCVRVSQVRLSLNAVCH